MKTISNAPVLVTGAASGMGAATARLLASQGAKVALLDMNIDLASKVAKEIGGLAIRCDVTSDSSAVEAVAMAREAHGPARVLVNCAGICPAKRIVSKDGSAMPLEDYMKVIQVNLIGTFNLMRLAAADMSTLDTLTESGERGVIINTASIAAYEGQIGQAAYSASKGGVVGMTLPAARELARYGIRVMTIAPGIMHTPMIDAMPQNVQDSLAASVPFPARMGRPEEFAGLVQQIVMNEYLNGSVIRLDAAIRMEPK